MLLSTNTVLSIIDILLSEQVAYYKSWDEEWDGHVGDLSAPDFHSITSAISTLEMLRRIITKGDQRVSTIVDDYHRPNFRNRDLFELTRLESKIDQQDFSGNITDEYLATLKEAEEFGNKLTDNITKEQHNESNS